MKLTENFTLDELTASQTAERLDIDNEPDDHTVGNLRFLCENLLQPIRDKFGPVIVTSGFRCHQLNNYIGGSKMSQHCRGEAADLKFLNADLLTVANWVRANNDLIYDQLLLEAYNPHNPEKGWLHLSLTGGINRKDVMTVTFIGGRANYSKGLPL